TDLPQEEALRAEVLVFGRRVFIRSDSLPRGAAAYPGVPFPTALRRGSGPLRRSCVRRASAASTPVSPVGTSPSSCPWSDVATCRSCVLPRDLRLQCCESGTLRPSPAQLALHEQHAAHAH